MFFCIVFAYYPSHLEQEINTINGEWAQEEGKATR